MRVSVCQKPLFSSQAFSDITAGAEPAVWSYGICPTSRLMMIAAAFLVLLRPYSIQCVLLLLLLLLGTIATILFFCCWHRRLRNGKHPIKSVLSGRSKSRVGLRAHHFRSEGFRHSPRHARRSGRARVAEEKPSLIEVPESDPDSSSTLRKRKVKKRVLPEFYQSIQVTPTRKPVGIPLNCKSN